MAASVGLVRALRQGYRLVSASRHVLQAKTVSVPTARLISTSKKNKDASIMAHEDSQSAPQVEPNLEAKEENWISYGYSLVDREADEFNHHVLMFACVTISLVLGSYILAYYPDLKNRDWTQREAYLELARREREGLPLIDRNLVDPANIDLPSEEELGDFEVII